MEIEESMEIIQDSVSGYFYSHNNGYEIMYGKGFSWRLRPINNGEWEEFTIDTSIDIFNESKLDLYKFQNELYNTVLDYAVYLNTRLKLIKEKVGEEALQERIESWENFGRQLIEVIEKTDKRNTIKLV